MPDASMTSPVGTSSCPQGSLLYVDPDQLDPKHGKPVLAQLASGHYLIAQFMEQAGRKWLHLLNPAYPQITEDFTVVGLVIFIGVEP
jgi:SOS-response transcriptional repressor LexA